MDYVPGDTIERIDPKEWSVDAFITLTVLLLQCVQRYHDLGVCHGDLKTKNLMIHSQKETLVIVDFGLSKFLPEKRDELESAAWLRRADWPQIETKQWVSSKCNDMSYMFNSLKNVYGKRKQTNHVSMMKCMSPTITPTSYLTHHTSYLTRTVF